MLSPTKALYLHPQKQCKPKVKTNFKCFLPNGILFCATKLMEMLGTLLITLLIVAICIVLLGVKVFFVKGGKFPNGHVSGNKAMRDRGIGCVQSQDREAQKKSRFSIDELEKTLNDSMN